MAKEIHIAISDNVLELLKHFQRSLSLSHPSFRPRDKENGGKMAIQNIGMVWVETVSGCMWGGKSEEVASRLKRAKFARKNILVVLPIMDNRKERNLGDMLREPHWLGTYRNLHVKQVDCADDLEKLMSELDPDILVLDEVHMFGLWPVEYIDKLRFVEKYQKKGLRVIVSGLDMDYLGKPFEAIAMMMAMAHDVRKLTHAICKKCEERTAFMTYKLPKNNKVNPDRLQVGGEKDYEPRCWECYWEDSKKE